MKGLQQVPSGWARAEDGPVGFLFDGAAENVHVGCFIGSFPACFETTHFRIHVCRS